MKPGATTSPLTSMVSRAAGTSVVTDAMRPSLIPTARVASRFVSGSSTRPPTSTTSREVIVFRTTWPRLIPSSWHRRVAHERQSLSIRRPRRDVDRSLSSIHISDHSRRPATDGYQFQLHVLVERMIVRRHGQWKGDVHDPLAVGRDVREPVVEVVVRDLLLPGPVGPHAPDLHPSAAHRVEVDVLAVGRVLRSVVESRHGGEADLVATVDRNLVNIEVAVSLADVHEPTSIGRPSVQVRGPPRGYTFRGAAGCRHRVDDRCAAVFHRMIADGQHS